MKKDWVNELLDLKLRFIKCKKLSERMTEVAKFINYLIKIY